jgi:hypothetical protein
MAVHRTSNAKGNHKGKLAQFIAKRGLFDGVMAAMPKHQDAPARPVHGPFRYAIAALP